MKKNNLGNDETSFLYKLAVLLAPTDTLILSTVRENTRKSKPEKKPEEKRDISYGAVSIKKHLTSS